MVTLFGRRLSVRWVSKLLVVSLLSLSLLFVIGVLKTRSDEKRASKEKSDAMRIAPQQDSDLHVKMMREVAIPGKISPVRVVPATGPKFFITTLVSGKLGNQMFQYAALLGIAYFNHMEPFYNPRNKLQSTFQVTHLHDRPTDNYHVVNEKDFSSYDPAFENLTQQDTVILQYFQSWKYFDFMRETIKKEFTFKEPVRLAAEKILSEHSTEIGARTRVGIHIRRGDMLMHHHIRKGYHVAPASYILKAMDYMRQKHHDVIFIVVSDSPDWCKSILNTTDYTIAQKASADVHMAVLSLCDHVIMTVGTYGWWGGYLSGGEVLYYWDPKYLLHNPPLPVEIKHPEDFFFPSWTPLTG